ncbi:MAG: riboflavin synthase subunit alpha [Parcubacteria group bacterium RIFCSPHIGHO2_01_FULL_56_18]|nr:MAG: riboflavin synthase subunit alpha [Parcubacteria group bacterium RIFCSPHIGHO2_01_FULL_56_18]
MFTGIIEATAPIIEARTDGSMRVRVKRPRGWKLVEGQSIAVDGICTTVEAIERDAFFATYMPETLRISTAGDFRKGRIVNLERSLKVGDRLDGHFVQGHVDCLGIVNEIRILGSSKEIRFGIPRVHMKYIATKGSITVNGVSLTVAARTNDSFTVALIPHTLDSTTLGTLSKGDSVNIETDLIARHLATLKGK